MSGIDHFPEPPERESIEQWVVQVGPGYLGGGDGMVSCLRDAVRLPCRWAMVIAGALEGVPTDRGRLYHPVRPVRVEVLTAIPEAVILHDEEGES